MDYLTEVLGILKLFISGSKYTVRIQKRTYEWLWQN